MTQDTNRTVEHEQCAEECREIRGASSCDALNQDCAGTGKAYAEAIWRHAGAPQKRVVRQSWTFVESSARLGHVAALPLATRENAETD